MILEYVLLTIMLRYVIVTLHTYSTKSWNRSNDLLQDFLSLQIFFTQLLKLQLLNN